MRAFLNGSRGHIPVIGLGALLAFGAASPVRAQFLEAEANDNKAAANAFVGLTSGATITGNAITGTAATPADYFVISTAAATPGIYQYRLTLTTAGAAGHIGTIRGLSQTASGINAGTDVALQTSVATTTPARFNQWYGFGRSEQLYYGVAGVAATTADYVATLTSTPITPTDIGSFAAGAITFNTVGQTGVPQSDTELFVLDSSFVAIPGYLNDDVTPGTGSGSRLTKNYTPGVYYLAVSLFNTADNSATPAGDRTPTDNVTDFPDILASSSTAVNANVGFAVTDANGTTPVASTKVGAYDINYYQFTVSAAAVPEPGSVALLASGLGLMGGVFLRCRRKASAA